MAGEHCVQVAVLHNSRDGKMLANSGPLLQPNVLTANAELPVLLIVRPAEPKGRKDEAELLHKLFREANFQQCVLILDHNVVSESPRQPIDRDENGRGGGRFEQNGIVVLLLLLGVVVAPASGDGHVVAVSPQQVAGADGGRIVVVILIFVFVFQMVFVEFAKFSVGLKDNKVRLRVACWINVRHRDASHRRAGARTASENKTAV